MKYLKKFEIHPEYTEFIETDEFIKPNVSCCSNETVLSKDRDVHYNPIEYFKFTALDSGTFTLTIGEYVKTTELSYIEYSIDDGKTWVRTNNIDNTKIIVTTPTVNAGDSVLWRGSGTRTTNAQDSNLYRSIFSSSAPCKVSGDIITLIGNNEPDNINPAYYTYSGLFYGMSTLIDASELILPRNLTGNDFYKTFYSCTNLTVAPALPSLSLKSYCYKQMFSGCSSLTTAPALPATTLASGCYSYMFSGCSSLTAAPELPATTLASSCYEYMFSGCSSLTAAPELPVTTLVSNCYQYMFRGCTSLTTAPALPATTLASGCYEYMFYGCTSLTTAPALPATTLISYCYYSMFSGCSSLTAAPELPATTLVSNCYGYMFYNCTSLTTVPALPATTLASNCYDYMFYSCRSLTYIKSAMKSFSYSSNWVNSVNVTGTFIKNPLTQIERGVNAIPNGWTVQNDTSMITTFNPQHTFTPAGYITFSHSDTMYLGLASKCSYHTIYVSKNGTNWHDLQTTDCLEFASNESCYVCGNLTSDVSNNNYTQFVVNGIFSISGNCNSIWNYNDLNTSLKISCGYNLFRNCTDLTDASNLILSATILANNCYYSMFRGCTSLTTAPELPAITLKAYCYQYMFSGCTSLTTAPALPATTLSSYCYERMFYNCTSLTTAPELPATTLAYSCYAAMFNSCTSLTEVPSTLPATTLTALCYSHMFYECTNITTTPIILATTLADSCCYSMFQNCTNLTTISELPATTLADSCCSNMFRGCTSLIDASITLPALKAAHACYYYMFYGCTSLEYPPIIKMTDASKESSFAYMFYGCKNMKTAPELLAITLNSYSYYYLFYDCTKLNYVKCLYAKLSGSSNNSYFNIMYSWLHGVSSTGIFVKNINATWNSTGESGVPTNWTILYFNPDTEKYYLSDKTTECDDHGNII